MNIRACAIFVFMLSGCNKGFEAGSKEHPAELVFQVELANGPEELASGESARVFSLSFGTRAASLIADFPGGAGLGPFGFALWGTGITHRGELASVHPMDAVGRGFYRNGTPAVESGYLPPHARTAIHVSETMAIPGIAAIHEYPCDNRRGPKWVPCVDVVFSNPHRAQRADQPRDTEQPLVRPNPLLVWGSGLASPGAWGHVNALMEPGSQANPVRVEPRFLGLKLFGPRGSMKTADDWPPDGAGNAKSGDEISWYPSDFSVIWPDGTLSHHGVEFDGDAMVRRIWEARSEDIAENDPSRRFLPNADCHPDDTWRYGARFWPARWSVEFDWFSDTGHIAEIRHLMNGLLEGAYFAYEPGGEVIVQGCYRGGLRHGVFFRFGYRGVPTRRTLVELELYTLGRSVARWAVPEDSDILWESCVAGTHVAGHRIASAAARMEGREPDGDVPWWLEHALAGVSHPLARPRNPEDVSSLCRVRLEGSPLQP
jgi:hypothetical protein